MSGSSRTPSLRKLRHPQKDMFILHLISYYHYVDNNVLLLPFDFEEVKHHHLEQALQQLVQDENGPDARTIIDMISNPPPLLESDDDDSSIPYFGDGGDVLHNSGDEFDYSKIGVKVNSFQKVVECVSILHKRTEEEKNKRNDDMFKSKKSKLNSKKK